MHPPHESWDARLPKEKRTWWLYFWIFSLVIAAIPLAWFYIAPNHEVPGQNMRVEPAEFHSMVTDWVKKNETSPGSGIVELKPGQPAYLEARMWSWYPVLKMKAGQTYTIWLSSMDVTHTLSIGGQHLMFDAMPGHMYGLTFTPDKPGTYLIYCSEFCGIGHQAMGSKIIVDP